MVEFGEHFVCAECIQDDDLAELIRDEPTDRPCSFCGREEPAAHVTDLAQVVQRMEERIDDEFTSPQSQLGLEPDPDDIYEGGNALFEAIEFGVDNETLQDLLEAEFDGKSYCFKDAYAPPEDDVFSHAWQRFSDSVKHTRRYTFWFDDRRGKFNTPGAHITVGDLLSVIGDDLRSLVYDATLPIGSKIWRIRLFDLGKTTSDPREHTSPPTTKANQPNRMSPAGVSMFYGSEDFETAFVETVDQDGEESELKDKEASGMIFEVVRPLKLLDLSTFPMSLGGFFASANRRTRQAAKFLNSFARELTKKNVRDGKQHIEYVPSQVFTEYVRFILPKEFGDIHGMKYKSSRNQKICYVIFADQEACLGGDSSMLRPDGTSWKRKRCRSR